MADGSPRGRAACSSQTQATYAATFHPRLVRTFEQVRAVQASRAEQILDARPRARYGRTQAASQRISATRRLPADRRRPRDAGAAEARSQL